MEIQKTEEGILVNGTIFKASKVVIVLDDKPRIILYDLDEEVFKVIDKKGKSRKITKKSYFKEKESKNEIENSASPMEETELGKLEPGEKFITEYGHEAEVVKKEKEKVEVRYGKKQKKKVKAFKNQKVRKVP